MTNYYHILGVDKGATQQEIKDAFDMLSKIILLEAKSGNPYFKGYFKKIKEAYEVISKPDHRKEFDRSLRYIETHNSSGIHYKSLEDSLKAKLELQAEIEKEIYLKQKEDAYQQEQKLSEEREEFKKRVNTWNNQVIEREKEIQRQLLLIENQKLLIQQSQRDENPSKPRRLSTKSAIIILSILVLIVSIPAVFVFMKSPIPPSEQKVNEEFVNLDTFNQDTIISDTIARRDVSTENDLDSTTIDLRMEAILELYAEINALEMRITKSSTPCGFVSVRTNNDEVRIIGRRFTNKSDGVQLDQEFFFDKGELFYVFESFMDVSGKKDQNRFYFLNNELFNIISSENHDPQNESTEVQLMDISNSIFQTFKSGKEIQDPECN